VTGAAQAMQMARTALAYWGGEVEPPRLIAIRENIVFEARLRDGTRAALRLHRPGYQSRAAIEAELDWTQRLAAAGVPVPEPVPTRQGRLTATVADRTVSCVSWIDGQPIGERTYDAAGRTDLFRRIGAMTGQFHAATDAVCGTDRLTRPHWDADGLLGEQPLWGRFWESPLFLPADQPIIARTRAAARDRLAELRSLGADFGLIHADMLRENLLETAAGLALIDFDDSGYGFRLYDLGTALVQNLEQDDLPRIARAICEGYNQTRPAAITPDDLVLFVLLRCLASCGWITTRAEDTDERRILYRARAMRMADAFLGGPSPLG